MTKQAIEDVAERLVQLGFSVYEARAYVGLLVTNGATGYRLANETGVPQPKVYEALRRLVDRGAAVPTGERPARYFAVPPSTLLANLEREFDRRLQAARRRLGDLPRAPIEQRPLVTWMLDNFPAAAQRAEQMIAGAQRRVYLSARTNELEPLAGAVNAAAERGVEFVIVHFGPLPFPRPAGRVVRHASTEGVLYASRRARHLAVAVDSRSGLWMLAHDGRHWEGLYGDTPLFASIIKAYIRHDLFIQRIYADAPAELEARYGPGLLDLNDVSAEPEESAREASEVAG